MRYKQLVVLVPLLFIGFVLVNGCKNSSSPSASMPDNPVTSGFVTVTPSDNATEVPADRQIVLAFAKPVDRNVVERNFHLISERAMPDSMCGMNGDMSHGSMGSGMMDSLMHGHDMSMSAMTGTFRWTANDTHCVFIPDSLMTSETTYYMHMDTDMLTMMREKMGGTGMQMHSGMMSNDDKNGGMMIRFRTGRAPGQGSGGQESHHP